MRDILVYNPVAEKQGNVAENNRQDPWDVTYDSEFPISIPRRRHKRRASDDRTAHGQRQLFPIYKG